MEIEQDWWRISDLTQKVIEIMREKLGDEKYSLHVNSVNRWFIELEKEEVHYVHRIGKEKAYNDDDLKIACMIAEGREGNRFRLVDLYERIPQYLKVREFPEDYKSNNNSMITDKMIEKKVEMAIENILGEKLRALNLDDALEKMKKEITKMLPEPVDHEQMQKEEFYNKYRQAEIELELEEEALEKWEEKKHSDIEGTTLKTGLFGKRVEDTSKKERFILEYKRKHLKEKMESIYSE